MSDFHDVTLNVGASLLFVLLGVAARAASAVAQHRGTRRFWGHLFHTPGVFLILGTFPRFRGFEPSGMIGVGDTRAVYELTRSLTRAGMKLEIAYSSRLQDGQLDKDVILLGGGDVNGIFRSIEESQLLGLRFEHQQTLSLYDVRQDKRYVAETVEVDLSQVADITLDGINIIERDGVRTAGRLVRDYGIIALLRNPYNPRRKLLIVAGLYGYGTWGGARLLSDESFLRRCMRLDSMEFECLFEVEVLQNMPIRVVPITLRGLS